MVRWSSAGTRGGVALLALVLALSAACGSSTPEDKGLLGAGGTPTPRANSSGGLPIYERTLQERGLVATPFLLAQPTQTPVPSGPLGGAVSAPPATPIPSTQDGALPTPTATPDCSLFLVFRTCTQTPGPSSLAPTSTSRTGPSSTATVATFRAVISPRDRVLSRGDTVRFEVQAFTPTGSRLRDIEVRWTAQGGVIDQSGVFRAGDEPGVYAVFATVIYKGARQPVVTTVVIQ